LLRRNNPDIDVLRLVYDWLQTEEAGSWLIILDNTNDINLFYPVYNSRTKAVTGFANKNTIARTD
jgi:hypothetical protein